ncbi:GSCFA domain-containing protein [Dinoroseobacter sp. S124A]|uniref:GSCFA domain-containing protein n=1 Tax=Dinoroseobacter sp. S124A TaxID=3415128 RepID=UPI003C7C7DCC
MSRRETAHEVLRRAGRNPFRRYPMPDAGGDRLYPLAMPASSPGFRISAEDTVFAMGSCFAREIETALAASGMTVLSRDLDLGPIGASLEDPANFFNAYTVPAMATELRWALERDSFPGAPLFYPLREDDSAYRDLTLGSAKLAFPRDEILAFRHRALDVTARVAEADLIVLTLGHVESWRDIVLDIPLNIAPPPAVCARFPERFAFEVLGYDQILAGLREIHGLLSRVRTKPLRMLLTVSPVPLRATFRDMDVLLANSYSKSVQRAAVDAFVAEAEGVDYFPSYECVTLSDPAAAWTEGDFRHVAPDLVARIMAEVRARYMTGEDDALRRAALVTNARLLTRMERYGELIDLLGDAPERARTPELQQAFAVALRRSDRIPEAVAAISDVVEQDPEDHRALERLIRWLEQLDRMAVARDYLDLHGTRFPKRRKFRRGRKARKAARKR